MWTGDEADPAKALDAPLAAFEKFEARSKKHDTLAKLGRVAHKSGKRKKEQDYAEPQILESLQGHWCQEGDGSFMGQIQDNMVVWDANYDHAPSKLIVARGVEGPCSAADIELELNGERHWGRYEGGENGNIVWSDGEVWFRVDVAALRTKRIDSTLAG